MPISSPHPLYEANLGRWNRCRAAYEGEDAVKSAGETYLPKVDPSQTGAEYAAYKGRAMYYEAVSRTVDGFVGAISRKPHKFSVPDSLASMLDDVTLDGTSAAEFVKVLTGDALLVGRGGLLVDFDTADNRPYFSYYPAEAVINWSATSVVLMESVYEADSADIFKQVEVPQIRQVHLGPDGCLVTLWRKSSAVQDAGGWAVYRESVPARRGVVLQELPWVWLSPIGRSAKVSKPPLLGLVNVSMSHYRSSADLEHGRHFTAMPTLYITGSSSTDAVKVGGGAAIVLSDAQAKVGYAEFTGQGLSSLEKAIEDKEQQMAVLGAAVFAGGKKGVEAAETARIRTSAENSLLMGVVSSVEESLTEALRMAAMWAGAPVDEVSVHLNRDFIAEALDPQTLVGMVQAFQAGAMTLDTFTYCLQQGDMLPPDTDLDDEVAKLAAAKAAADKVLAAAAKPGPAVPAPQSQGDK